MNMELKKIDPMVPNADGTPINPFRQDMFHMGQQIGINLMMMFYSFDNQPCRYLIFVDQITGERFQLDISQ